MSRSNWQRLRIAGYLAAFHLFAFSIGAYGGQIYSARQVVCAPLVKAAAFTYQQPIVGGYYMPAEALQQRAAQQFAMEASPDLADFQAYQQFRQFEAWKAGQQPAAQPENSSMSYSHTEPATEPPAAPSAAGELPPPAPSNQYPFAAKFPLIVAKCATCHGGINPDAGLFLDGQIDLQSPHLDGRRNEIMDAIVNNRMPRKAGTDECVPLSGSEIGEIVAELWLK